jgi:hypothetical protein
MRLQAAVSLLHLSTVPKFAAIVTNNFVSLAIMIQVCFRVVQFCPRSSYAKDPCYQVRDEFLRKYISLATHQRLPPHFNVIPFLTIHDPEADIRNIVRGRLLPLGKRSSLSSGKSIRLSGISCLTPRLLCFEHLTVDYAESLRLRCQNELLRDDLCPVPSSARTSPRFLSHSRKSA